MFVVGPVGAAILAAEDAWSQFRKEQGIRDPFWDVKMKNFQAKHKKTIIDGVECEVVDLTVSDKIQLEPNEIERYNDLHDKFIATYIFVCGGYDLLCRTQYKMLKDLFRPCDDPTGQCSMECPRYNNCNIKDPKIYPNELNNIFEFIKKDLEGENKC